MAELRRTRDGAPVAQLRIECHIVGEPTPGQWCPTCMVSSAVEFEFAIVDATTLTTFGRGTGRRCYQCGNPVPLCSG